MANASVKAPAPPHMRARVHGIDDRSSIVLKTISYIFVSVFSILCLVPFWLLVVASFTAESEIIVSGYAFWPDTISGRAYEILFLSPKKIIGSYVVTIILTAVGTFIGLICTAMTGYALQRPDFVYRNRISLYIYFTTLFSGGVVPFYLLIVVGFGWKDNYLSILVPTILSSWNIILMKNFTRSIPHSITESALIDGANDFVIFLKIILPMSAPSLATVGLFIALGYWNEWYNAMLFLTQKTTYKPLQLFLYEIINKAAALRDSAAQANVPPQDLPGESLKMATAVVATGPIVLVYPFIQRYFIKGITIGAVKG